MICFSPSYVEEHPKTVVHAGWDAWSIGLTCAVLLVLEPFFRAKFMQHRRQGATKQEANFLEMESCTEQKAAPIP